MLLKSGQSHNGHFQNRRSNAIKRNNLICQLAILTTCPHMPITLINFTDYKHCLARVFKTFSPKFYFYFEKTLNKIAKWEMLF